MMSMRFAVALVCQSCRFGSRTLNQCEVSANHAGGVIANGRVHGILCLFEYVATACGGDTKRSIHLPSLQPEFVTCEGVSASMCPLRSVRRWSWTEARVIVSIGVRELKDINAVERAK